MIPYIKNTLERVEQRNPGETVFLQAVKEMVSSLDVVLGEHPEFEEANVLERLCEPERQISFQVPWVCDKGSVHVNRGFRTGFNSTLGPYKGGLRFHPSVDTSVIKFLAFEQIFKNSLTGMRIGGGKGGSDFDPKGRSNGEIMRFCQSFMNTLFRYLGPHTDIPAGDIGVGAREIGYLFGQYKKLAGAFTPGVLTGKDPMIAGSPGRKEATGYGCVYFADAMLRRMNDSLQGKTCLVSGSGNVALYAIEKLQHLGAKPVACSDSKGAIYDPGGLNLETLKHIKEVERGRLSSYKETHPHAVYNAEATLWNLPCDLAFPCATQNELTGKDALELVKNNCQLVCEGANMPCTPEAIAVFEEHRIAFAPGKAANAGGVAVSALEMQQNAVQDVWSTDMIDTKLKAIMNNIHDNCLRQAERYGSPHHYAKGANIAGFLRVAQAVLLCGI